jgi:hypothetical protein
MSPGRPDTIVGEPVHLFVGRAQLEFALCVGHVSSSEVIAE